MTAQLLRDFFGWSTLLHFGLLFIWFFFFVFAHDWVFRLHGKWFQLSREQFDAIHYGGLAGYKILIFLFGLIPYLALRIIT